MKKKILSLLLIVLLTFTLTACDMLNGLNGNGTGTQTVDVNLDDVFLNVEAQINTKDALENNITLPTSFGSVNVTWVSSNTKIIDNTGRIVARPDEDTEVILNCTLTSAKESKTYKIKVTIKAKDPEPEKVLAHLPADLQGTYKADGVTVVISESKVAITDPSGTTVSFDIYVDNNQYYIEENGLRVFCTFENNTVTNSHGTFVKDNGQPQHDPVANLPDALQGTYKSGNITVIVSASKVVVMEEGNDQNTYVLYVDASNQYYVEEEGQKIVCTFGTDSVTNKFGTFVKDNGQPQHDPLANLPENLQGTYYGDGVTVVVSASSVAVTDPTGKTLTFDIYNENGKYYIEEEGSKVYCTFENDSVTNRHGTFTKNNGQTQHDPLANLPENLQGTYYGDGVTVVVNASNVAVTDPSGKTLTYDIYDENGKYYIEEEGSKVYCTFGTDSVTNKYGTFTKNNGQQTPTFNTLAEAKAGTVGNTYKVKAVVVATSNVSFLLQDESDLMLVYFKNGYAKDLAVGDEIELEGATTTYSGTVQFNGGTYTKVGTKQAAYPTPRELSATDLGTIAGSTTIEYVQIEGVLRVSGSYVNLEVEGATVKGSVLTDKALADFTNKNVVVTGYYLYTTGTSTKYVNLIATELKLSDNQGPELQTSSIAEVLRGTVGDTYKVEATVVALSNGVVVVKDATGFMTLNLGSSFDGSTLAVGAKLSIQGPSYKYGGVVQLNYPEYEVIGKDSVTHPEPLNLNKADLEELVGSEELNVQYVKVLEAKLVVSGSYYNLVIDDCAIQGSIVYPINAAELKALDGEIVSVEGYFVYVTGSTTKYASIVCTSIYKTQSSQDQVAKLPATLQGTYKAGDITVEVGESSVTVKEEGHDDHRYILYVDASGSYYVLEEGKKIVCTFGDNTVTNDYGTFTKETATLPTVLDYAELDEALQGAFENEEYKVIVRTSSIKLSKKGSDEVTEADLWIDANFAIFFNFGDVRIYCDFKEAELTTDMGAFVRCEITDEEIVADVKDILQKWNNYEVVLDPGLEEELNGCTIVWTSTNEDVMTSSGKATLQAEDTVVKFNVTVSKNNASETFEITFIVKKYETISTLLALEESEISGFNFFATKAIVVANYVNGFLLKDETGYIVVYNPGSEDVPTLGAEYIVRGMLKYYDGINEFATFFKYEATGEAVTLEDPEYVSLDAEMVARLSKQMVITPVELKGLLTISSGKYINVSISDSTFTGSINGNVSDYEQFNNKAIIVKGYLVGINGKYAYILPLEVEEDENAQGPELSQISDVLAGTVGERYAVQGIVVARNAQMIVIQDETGHISAYFGTSVDIANTFAIGTEVTLTGATTTHNGKVQFSSPAYEVGEVQDYTYPEAAIYEGEAFDTLENEPSIKFIKVVGKLSVSNDGKYYNLIVEGATLQGSLTYPLDTADLQELNGKMITVEGYYVYVAGSSTRYANIVYTAYEEAEVPADELAQIPADAQGPYMFGELLIAVYESSVEVATPQTTAQYDLYVDADGNIYCLEDNEKVYLVFGEGTITYKDMVFTKQDTPQPDDYVTISEVLEGFVGLTYKIKGIVVARTAQLILVQDETNYIVAYFGEGIDIANTFALGAEVVLEGASAWYGGRVQLSKPTYTIGEIKEFTQPEATVLDKEAFIALDSADADIAFVKLTGKLVVSENGKYFNMVVGDASLQASLSYPLNAEELRPFDGKLICVEGYFIYVNGQDQRYANIICVAFEEAEVSDELAHVDEDVQGQYKYGDMVLVVKESSVEVTTADGTFGYDLYLDEENKIYIIDDGAKEYPVFGEGTITYKNMVFTKEETPLPVEKDNILDASTITKLFEVNEDGTWTVTMVVIADEQYENPRFVVRDTVVFGFLNGEYNEDLYQENSALLEDESNLVVTEEPGRVTIKVTIPAELVAKYTSQYYAATAEDGTCFKGGLALDLYLEFYDGEEDYSPNNYGVEYLYGSLYFFRSYLDVVETTGDGTEENPLTAADATAIAAYLPAGIWTKAEFYIEGTVVGEPNAKYGNLLLQNGETTFTVYGLYTNDGEYQYGTASGRVEEIPVHDGDKVLLLAQIYHYEKDGKTTLETRGAKLIQVNDDAVTYEALPEYRMIEITPLNGVKEGYVYYVEGYRNGQNYFGKFVEVEDGIINCQVRYVCDSFRIFEYLQPEEGEEFAGYTRYTNILGLDATECAFHGREDLTGSKSFEVNEDGTWTVTMVVEANEVIEDPRFEVVDVKVFGYQNGVWDNALYLDESVILNDKSNLQVTIDNGTLTVTVIVPKALVATYASEYYLPDIYNNGTCYKGGIALDLYIKFYDGDIDLSYDDNFFGTFYCFHSFLDVVETTGDGTIDNPLTAADAYALAAYLPEGVWTNDEYYIVGTVVSVDPAWCNLAFQVGEDTFLVYGIATADGEYKYGATPNKVQGIPVKVDDKVLLLAQVYNYVKDGVSTLEAKDAKLILVNDEEVTYELVEEEEYETSHAGTADDPLDGADVALIASHLDATTKEQTEVRYYIEAVVAEVEDEPTSTYCNFHLVTGGEEVLVYGLAEDEAFTQRYGTKREIATLPEGLAAGNTVVLYGYIQNYSGTFEIIKAQLLKIVPAQGE